MTRWYIRDLDTRSTFVAKAVQEPLGDLVRSGSTAKIASYFNDLTDDERLYAVGLCTSGNATVIASIAFPAEIKCPDVASYAARERTIATPHGPLHVTVRAVPVETTPGATMKSSCTTRVLASAPRNRGAIFFYLPGPECLRRADWS
jgi:trehalose 6-phosphate synthase